jgi:hypothetical protein
MDKFTGMMGRLKGGGGVDVDNASSVLLSTVTSVHVQEQPNQRIQDKRRISLVCNTYRFWKEMTREKIEV